MKKLLVSLFLVAGLSAMAQNFLTIDMLNAQSIVVSNTISWTNLVSGGAVGSTNTAGNEYTNIFGTKTVHSTNAAVAYYNIFKDVTFPTDFVARYGQSIIDGTNSTSYPSGASINVALVGGSGANAATTFVFQFLDGEGGYYTDRSFTFQVTPTTTTAINMCTNIPVTYFWGAKGMRCEYILAGDKDASSSVTISKLNFNCWTP